MKDRRPDTHERDSDENSDVGRRACQQQQADQGEPHPDCQRIGLRPLVGDQPDDRLQQRCGDGVREGNEPNLAEVQTVGGLQNRVDRGEDRLQQVVQTVAETDCAQDAERSLGCRRTWPGGGSSGRHSLKSTSTVTRADTGCPGPEHLAATSLALTVKSLRLQEHCPNVRHRPDERAVDADGPNWLAHHTLSRRWTHIHSLVWTLPRALSGFARRSHEVSFCAHAVLVPNAHCRPRDRGDRGCMGSDGQRCRQSTGKVIGEVRSRRRPPER